MHYVIDMEENITESHGKTALLEQEAAPKRIYPIWLCPVCGTKTWITNKKRHLNTKKHKDVVYITHEKFEMR